MALSQNHVRHVCLVGNGSEECRYLEQDDNDWQKFVCKKISPEKKDIDEEVVRYIKECKDAGKDPDNEAEPIGDNCKGYLPLQSLIQGYDVDKKP